MNVIQLQAIDEFSISTRPVARCADGNGTLTVQHLVTFKAEKGQATAGKLVFSGSRSLSVEVPFTLKDVPLQ